MFKKKQPDTTKRIGPSKLVTGFIALATTAVVGTAGVAGAQTPGNMHGHGYANGNGNRQHNNFTIHIRNVYNSTVNVVVNIWP